VTNQINNSIKDRRVSAAIVPSLAYEAVEIERALLQNCKWLGWASPDRGALGRVIPTGAKVVVKPNLVLHQNRGKGGLLELVTNASIIKAVVLEALKADPSCVIVGDAPIQSCDFQNLLESTGLSSWSADLMMRDSRFGGIVDFRRTVSEIRSGIRYAQDEIRPIENYVLYNLGSESMLESISDEKHPFRVTCYDPRLLEKTHSPGNHQYLVARDVIDAEVVVNLPKLKTHKKAGITNALKNLVGINGNKEYLPHHRLGGSTGGGDCYPGNDPVKRVLEAVLDKQNSATTRVGEKAMAVVSENLQRVVRLRGDKIGVEGSWSGNRTVALMTLDLNRILHYGKPDGTFSDEVQRRVIHVCDAVVAGQGDGPLASEPLDLNVMLASENPAAMDWVGAQLLGYDPEKIPLLVHAFEDFRWPIAKFQGREVTLLGDLDLLDQSGQSSVKQSACVRHPAGWKAAAA